MSQHLSGVNLNQPPTTGVCLAALAGSQPVDRHRDEEIRGLAASQQGVVTLEQLRQLGISPGRRRAQIAARRWTGLRHRAIVVGGGRGTSEAAWWTALAEVGRPAALGGVTALMADGLTGFDEELIHVWLPKSSRVVRPDGVRVHETRRWEPSDTPR